MFTTIESAARGLLLSTCATLNSKHIRYVIAGGWVPVLRGGVEGLQHPGTRDVDVLFNDSLDHMNLAVTALLETGFRPSAKHEFQLLLPIKVQDRTFVFNVDLMHPSEQQHAPGMFADIFDLGVNDAYDPTGKRWIKSIIFPSSRIVFNEHLWSALAETGIDAQGSDRTVNIPLLNEVALILSKIGSIQHKKRTRDGFDIYYVLCGKNRREIAASLRDLVAKYDQVREDVRLLRDWIRKHGDLFDKNVSMHAGRDIPNAANDVLSRLGEIFT